MLGLAPGGYPVPDTPKIRKAKGYPPMKPREARLWQAVRTRVVAHWVRVENRVNLGTPDIVGVLDGRTLWVELKALASWSDPTLEVSREQYLWLRAWARAGGSAWVVARVGDTVLLVHARELSARGYTRAQWQAHAIGVWPSHRVDWAELRTLLLSDLGTVEHGHHVIG